MGQPAAAAATPSQQSMMQDMFVENYRRPSSRLGGGEAEEDPDRIEVNEFQLLTSRVKSRSLSEYFYVDFNKEQGMLKLRRHIGAFK